MKRRDFITLLGGAALWAPALRAQPQRVYQVGFITLQSAEIAQANLKSLRDNSTQIGLGRDAKSSDRLLVCGRS